MPAVDRQFRSRGVNQYVPRMAYATNMVHTQPVIFSLGTPAAVVANSILAAGSAQATVNVMQFLASVFTMVEPYGRTLRVTPSGDPGNSFAVDIFGEDYLGQPMAERFTGASGSTAILYGKKAFYRVISWVTRVVSTNAITIAVGTGFRLGLPYKSDIVWNMEALLPVNTYKRDTQFQHERAAAFAITGGSTFIRAPFPGFVKNLFAYADSAGGGANPVITVKLGGTAITGLTVTLVDNTPGILQQGVPTTAGYNANNRFIKDQMIEIAGAAAAGATGDRVGLELTPTQFTPGDPTDPQTLTTGDPRGTYEALLTYDGVSLIQVACVGDVSLSALGNGGLHGIKHVIA